MPYVSFFNGIEIPFEKLKLSDYFSIKRLLHAGENDNPMGELIYDTK